MRRNVLRVTWLTFALSARKSKHFFIIGRCFWNSFISNFQSTRSSLEQVMKNNEKFFINSKMVLIMKNWCKTLQSLILETKSGLFQHSHCSTSICIWCTNSNSVKFAWSTWICLRVRDVSIHTGILHDICGKGILKTEARKVLIIHFIKWLWLTWASWLKHISCHQKAITLKIVFIIED